MRKSNKKYKTYNTIKGSSVTQYFEGEELVGEIVSQNEYILVKNGKSRKYTRKYRGFELENHLIIIGKWITEVEFFEI